MAGHVLVTGGAGYIGSHTCVALLEAGYRVTVVDNFSNSSPAAMERVAELAVEEILRDLSAADPGLGVALLRYFNPAGAHPSGRIGEDPRGTPNNLTPFVMQVAVGRLPEIRVYGDDYATADGTGVRDYVHVMDLADGHVAALRRLESGPGCLTVNLGTGRGYSVLEVIASASKACGRSLPYSVVERRPGDVAEVVADPGLAAELLGWRAQRSLDEMCADHWRWQEANPEGYRA